MMRRACAFHCHELYAMCQYRLFRFSLSHHRYVVGSNGSAFQCKRCPRWNPRAGKSALMQRISTDSAAILQRAEPRHRRAAATPVAPENSEHQANPLGLLKSSLPTSSSSSSSSSTTGGIGSGGGVCMLNATIALQDDASLSQVAPKTTGTTLPDPPGRDLLRRPNI